MWSAAAMPPLWVKANTKSGGMAAALQMFIYLPRK